MIMIVRDMLETTDAEKTWGWLRTSEFKVKMEALIYAP